MKKIILLLIIAGISNILSAQTTYEFGYDNTGNRILRHVVELRHTQTNNNSNNANNSDSTTLPQTATMGDMQISVMPNPTAGNLQISITNLPEAVQGGITVWDLNSKEIYKQDGIYATNKIDLSKQQKGIYMMQIRVGSKKSEWKVVKE